MESTSFLLKLYIFQTSPALLTFDEVYPFQRNAIKKYYGLLTFWYLNDFFAHFAQFLLNAELIWLSANVLSTFI